MREDDWKQEGEDARDFQLLVEDRIRGLAEPQLLLRLAGERPLLCLVASLICFTLASRKQTGACDHRAAVG